MAYLLDRPAAAFDPGRGALIAEQFQVAYVTNDVDRACDLFERQLGIREFARLEGPNPEGGQVRAEFAWVGSVMYEIIGASGPGNDIFMGLMPRGPEFQMVHHHLGYLIHDQAQWDALLDNAARSGLTVASQGENPFVQVCFLAVPGLPHYLEYLFPTPLGLDFFNGVPRS